MTQAAVESARTMVRSAIGDEAMKRLNLTGDLQEMIPALEVIHAAIPHAEICWMEEHPDRPGEWLRKVRQAAYGICHMLDELLQNTKILAAGNKMVNMLAHHESVVIEPKTLEMLAKMKKIKRRLNKLQKKSDQFDVKELTQPHSGFIGREEDRDHILAHLSACHSSKEKGPTILLIRGDNGVGKATVATMVFDDDRFKCYSRVCVSCLRSLELHEVGKYIISHVSDGEEDMSRYGSEDTAMKHVTNRLHELLSGKKTLIFLHDLRDETNWWKGLKDMLSVGGMSSTEVIVIATIKTYKEDEVAMDIFGVLPYCLEPLSEDMCCKIIKQAAVRSQDRSADKEDLEKIAPEVAKLCEGMPMAAQILGSLLQFTPYRERPQLLDFNVLPTKWSTLKKSLQLSYRSMPPQLQLCFAYFAMFTTEPTIVKGDLIHQWVALDLIEPSEVFSTTQLAEQYLKRLMDLSLLQTAKSSRTSGNDDSCETSFIMHTEVRQFVEDIMGSDYGWVDENGVLAGRYQGCCNALAVDVTCKYKPFKSILPNQRIRALRCLGCSKLEFCDDSFSFARCMRVLELHESSMQNLPESIFELRHLRYLKLSGWSGLVTLPESIGNLINLLHIDLSACPELVNLPESFRKLVNMVHISLAGCSKLEILPESIRKLIKLVHIDLSGCSALVHLPEFLGNLIYLVHINLSGCSALVHLPRSFVRLRKLKRINLSGCPALVNLPESFGKLINLEHINLSGCPKLVNLPGSFGRLTNLKDINLSGCSGLVKLPGSFGKLTSLAHVNLSGCSALEELPESFGKLRSLLHINLSGCSGLATLPGSFGELKYLLHVDLSSCHGLLKLPESFGNLKKLIHLDLSFWSCFEGIQTALGGLTSLQHLNLSQPCCYPADYSHLKGLKEVLGRFIRLKHLSLSMFLNPIFCDQSEVENSEYIEFIGELSRLEYLDLSHSIFLRGVPESLGGLQRLHTLDLSGCIRLEEVEHLASMNSIGSIVFSNLKSYRYYVGEDDVISNYGRLVDATYKELEIHNLQRINSVAEAQRIRLAEKENLQSLKLRWAVGEKGSMEDKALLGELVPPHSLERLEIDGYVSTCFPEWLTLSISSFNLVEITMEKIPNCSHLPPLGLLPNLQRVVLRKMASLVRIDTGELSGGNSTSFRRLCKFTIDDMGSLDEFNTTYYNNDGAEEVMFPVIEELVVQKCPNLSFVPCPPRARRLVVSDCNDVMVCWRNRAGRHGVEGPSCITSPVTQVTELVVESCRVYLSHWCLLNHLPGLRTLTIKNCINLISSRQIIGALSSLRTLCFSHCKGMRRLPEHLGGLKSLRELQIESCSEFTEFGLDGKRIRCPTSLESIHISDCESIKELPRLFGDLTSLQKLAIERCKSIKGLPDTIGKLTNLKDLHIKDCAKLKSWCEEGYNRQYLRHIRPKLEETPSSELGEQHSEIEEYDSEDSSRWI